MRLFIATQTGAALASELLRLQKQMRISGVTGSYTREQNLHMTLAFIGEYDDPGKVLSAIRESEPVKASVTLCGFGAFGDLYYASLDTDVALYENAERLRHALDRYGIPYDKKKFKPHITLVRRAGNVRDLPRVRSVADTVTRTVLMRSDRTERGMVYTVIGSCDHKEKV